jgi:hypothetical protein
VNLLGLQVPGLVTVAESSRQPISQLPGAQNEPAPLATTIRPAAWMLPTAMRLALCFFSRAYRGGKCPELLSYVFMWADRLLLGLDGDSRSVWLCRVGTVAPSPAREFFFSAGGEARLWLTRGSSSSDYRLAPFLFTAGGFRVLRCSACSARPRPWNGGTVLRLVTRMTSAVDPAHGGPLGRVPDRPRAPSPRPRRVRRSSATPVVARYRLANLLHQGF